MTLKVRSWFKLRENLMHVAAFIGKLQHHEYFKPSYLGIGKWAISLFLSHLVTHTDISQSAVIQYFIKNYPMVIIYVDSKLEIETSS